MNLTESVVFILLVVCSLIPSAIAAIAAVLTVMKVAVIQEMVNGQRADLLSEIAMLKEEIVRLKQEIKERSAELHKALEKNK